jgi:hypothetical protein
MHGLKAHLCKGSCHGEAVAEGLLRKSSKYSAFLKNYNLFKAIPPALRATSLYTREALIPAKPKNRVYR